jgi:hypothetical protein
MLLIAAVAGLFALCGGLAYVAVTPKNGIRVEQLEAELRERLPEGSSWQHAEEWFASHGIKPGYILDASGRSVGLTTTIPNNTLLESAEIQIFLYFDDRGRLRERVVRRLVYSL